MLKDRDKQFLLKLADLVEEYDATIAYNMHDDGVHILTADGHRDIFVDTGFSDNGKELSEALRKAAK